MKYQVNVNKILANKQKQVEKQPSHTEKETTKQSLRKCPKGENEVTKEEMQEYLEFQDRARNMFFDDNDITMEQFVAFTRDCIRFEYIDNVMEATTARKMTRAAEKKLRKVNHTINGHKDNAVKNMKRIDDKVSDVANRKLDDIINTGKDMKRDKILQGRPQFKLSKFIK